MRFGIVLALSLMLASPAAAQTQDARSAVAEALFAYSATTSAADGAMDARIQERRRSIAALRERVRQDGGRTVGLAAELAGAQERFTADLAARDRAYEVELAVFRGAVTDIASQPEGLAALQRFNAGDELGALVALDRVRQARSDARSARNDIESAAEGRRIATLALEARDRGRLDTSAVVARYDEVTRLDPGVHWDWIELSRLHQEGGNLVAARQMAERSAAVAQADRDRVVSLGELGDVLRAQGDLAGARARYEQSFEIVQRLAAAEPGSTLLQRDVAVNHHIIGNVMFDERNWVGALSRYEQSLAIFRRLASTDPSASARRDVSLALIREGDIYFARREYRAAEQPFTESLALSEALAAENPSSTTLQREVAVNLNKLGDALFYQNNVTGSGARYRQSLEIVRTLAASDPTSLSLQRDIALTLQRVGGAAFGATDYAGARAIWEEALQLGEALIARDPSDARYHNDAQMTRNLLAQLPGGPQQPRAPATGSGAPK